MSLYEKLKTAKSEEDVKDAYIKALGITRYNKGLIDIRTDEIWFEAKDKPISTYKMFTQLLHYVQSALNKGETLPPILGVIDTAKAAIMETEKVLPLLKTKTIPWGKSASQFSQGAEDIVSAYIGTHFVSFKIETQEREFIDAVKTAMKSGNIIRTQITPDNLKQVFDRWVDMIGREIGGVAEENYNLLFYADIMMEGQVATHDNLPAALLYKNGNPVFMLDNKLYELGNKEGYRQFWNIYSKPPATEHRDKLLERRDSLIPTDERSFKGAYYTPLHVVDKAYDTLSTTLGKNWQRDYIVWDMCCGVGNLETKHNYPRNLFMSTLDQADVDIMHATKTCIGAERFQYDYLNDDINEFGQIDYSLTNKVPQPLRDAIVSGKKILVLINPPYAEATSSDNINSGGKADASKTGVAKTKYASITKQKYGKASNELFTQFVARIAAEIPNATLAMFSTLKYVNSQTMDKFRLAWNAKYVGGFVVHSQAFDGIKGNFPIGFLIWKTEHNDTKKIPIKEISVDILDKNAAPIGEKFFYNLPNNILLTNWMERPKPNSQDSVPLKNAITPATTSKDLRGIKWSDNAIAYMWCNSNDLQQAQRTALFSSGYSGGHGIFITGNNLWQAAIVYAVRQSVAHTWINHNDQFLQPDKSLSSDFQNDCLIYMLFHGKNLTASANDLDWNGQKWSIVNHFIPFTETEVVANGRFESDFMVNYLSDKTLSPEALAVLNAGRDIWRAYFTTTDTHNVREELKLNRPDVGWYQIRNAIKRRNDSGDYPPVDMKPFEAAYKILSQKLTPQVYELGFLRA